MNDLPQIQTPIDTNANAQQLEAISHVDGPLLIIAGPGTGKTFTLVQRAVHLIQDCGVKPEEILMTTFTEKAAKELVTRITNELSKRDITVNLQDMYIGTFHSLCLRILKEHLEFTRLKKNYRLLDRFDQLYMVYRNYWNFKEIPHFDDMMAEEAHGEHETQWHLSERLTSYINTLNEECVEIEKLKASDDIGVSVLGNVVEKYQSMLSERNLLDFATIQIECYKLLKEQPDILQALQQKLRYIMIDEYQDTNYIQEQLVFLLGGQRRNICVVGDDDQGLYRFRGATIRNILEFPQKFSPNECKIVYLDVNYRSNSDIVDFYNKWMTTTSGDSFEFDWRNFRFSKNIKASQQTTLKSSGVAKLSAVADEDEWHENILKFIRALKESGKIQDYNQIAFLCRSVKGEGVISLIDYLEEHDIHVYSPRSDLFFQRDEVKLLLGCLLAIFPIYTNKLGKGEYKIGKDCENYYIACVKTAMAYLAKPEAKDLKKWMRQVGEEHAILKDNLDYAYTGLAYQLFAFEPFTSILKTDMASGVADSRPMRNLAMLTQILGKYEYLHNVSVLTGKPSKNNSSKRMIDESTERLFNTFLRCLMTGGIDEYEDDSEYAPSGCISFMTIHQSKGMEFPIVVVDSLGGVPRTQSNPLLEKIETKFYHRPPFEPHGQIKYFDFWRLYYTAFSRAQDLLVLTCNENTKTPSCYFRNCYASLPDVNGMKWDMNDFTFKTVKDVNLKDTFSFTSHISVYETCALQYKFYKELGFLPVREGAMLFGRLVHETIEDIHRAVLRGEKDTIDTDRITQWFYNNYSALTRAEHSYLVERQQEAALRQVLNYAERQRKSWDYLKDAEVEVTCVQPDYIIKGCIDLIKGQDGTVELVDFKSERKPDLYSDKERIERYRRQLHLYAWLVEQRTGQKVSKMHLYYTGEDDGNPMISFPYSQTAIDGTMAAFDDTVHKILNRDFSQCANSGKTCRGCDFRFFCGSR